MRAAAVALVLIVGAAVVLWFGNMLNSWVLGGLMGGLAALLLSIPISLTLFSFLARRHDERLKAADKEEMLLARSYDYDFDDPASEEAGMYDPDVYTPEEAWPEEFSGRRPASRNLSAPNYPRLPAAGQSHAPIYAAPHQRGTNLSPLQRQQLKTPPVVRGKGAAAQHLSPDRRTYYPGFPGYTGKPSRSAHQSAALRAARREAVQQRNDVEVLPSTTYNLRRLPPARLEQNSGEHPLRPSEPRASRQLEQQAPYPVRRRRTVDANPPQSGYPDPRHQIGEPQTEPLNGNDRYLQTGPLRQQQTGQMARNPQADEPYHNSQMITGNIKNPLVRRAPYMYEDDPLRQKLAQQIDPPIVRRSSRYEEEDE